MKVLNTRTRGGTSTTSSASISPQLSIPKKKRKHSIRKLKVSTDEMEENDQIEAATDLVTREVSRKKAADAVALQRALEIAKDTNIPGEVLLKESSGEHAQKVVELAKNLQELVVVGDLLNVAEEVQRENVPFSGSGTSEADASKATRANTNSHNISNNLIEIESSPSSISTSTSSDNIDDVPLSRVYQKLQKSLAPSPSTKNQKKPVVDEFVPIYPCIQERKGDMAQMRFDVCARLPANHLFQPPFIQPHHLNATHSNISFGITLRNIASKRSSFLEQSVSDSNSSLSEEQIFGAQPISVALPSSETTFNPAEPEQLIIERVVDEVPTQTGTTLASSLPFVLKHVNDPPFVPNRIHAIESNTTTIIFSEPFSSNTTQLTNIIAPPTLLLDSTILKETCERSS